MYQALTTLPAAAAGTFAIGGYLTVNRMGYGAMRITQARNLGAHTADKKAALATLRKAVELGVNTSDTADSYGPGISGENLLPKPSTRIRPIL